MFLPQGFPESVSEDYLQYQFWDTVQVQKHPVINEQKSGEQPDALPRFLLNTEVSEIQWDWKNVE